MRSPRPPTGWPAIPISAGVLAPRPPARRSTCTKAISSSTEPIRPPIVATSAHPTASVRTTVNTSSVSPPVARTAPSTSGRRAGRPGRSDCTATRTSAIAISAIGTLMNITQRQLAYWVRTPPISTPRAPPAAFIALQTPNAFTRGRPSGKVALSRARAAGARAAAPTPCSALAATSCPGNTANPPTRDAAANSARPASSTTRRPNRSAALPPSSSSPPNVSA